MGQCQVDELADPIADGLAALGMGEDGSGSLVTVRVPKGNVPMPGDRVQVRVSGNAIAYEDARAATSPPQRQVTAVL